MMCWAVLRILVSGLCASVAAGAGRQPTVASGLRAAAVSVRGASSEPSATANGPKAGSCWTAGFMFEDCCAPEFGPEGNEECWDDVYTNEVCCGEGLDPAEKGCESPYFTKFRKYVVEYYATGRARPPLIELFPRLIASYDQRFELCAAAVLQASLLQLEERVCLEPAALGADRVAGYALRLQRGVEGGFLKAADAERWPLELGLQRLRVEAQRKAQRSLSSVRRQPGVALVLSYCREDLGWMNSTLSQAAMRGVDLVMVQKCPGADAAAAVPHRRVWRSVLFIEVEDMPFRADECSAYLGYMAQEYHRLPEHMVFVHADAPEHIGSLERPNILDDTLLAVVHGTRLPFAHLGGNRVTMAWNPHTMSLLWRGLFGSSLVPGPKAVRTYCCSHFVVSRARVQLRPRAFYEDALAFITSPPSYSFLPTARPRAFQRDVEGRLVCQNMMFVWHAMFGEALDLPHRMFDPNLPFFLKIRNLRTAYLNL